MTRWMLKRAWLNDDIPERMIERGVCVATDNFGRYPVRTKQFIKRNFIPVSFRTLVAGRVVKPTEPVMFFDIAIPARYAVISKTGATVEIDGKPCAEFVALAPGRHALAGTRPVRPGGGGLGASRRAGVPSLL